MPDSDAEDDYMTMALPPSPPRGHSTSLARAAAKRRAGELSSQPTSKRAQTATAAKRLDAGLSRSLLTPTDDSDRDATALGSGGTNRGQALLAKMGYTGGGLGAGGKGEVEPLRPQIREGRGGIGSEPKKEAKAEVKPEKKLVEEVGDYRARIAREGREKRDEGRLRAAVRMGEGLAAEDDNALVLRWGRREQHERDAEKRREKERRRRMDRLVLDADVSGVKDHDGLDDDADDMVARGESLAALPETSFDEEEEADAEVDAFAELTLSEKLEKAVLWLRKDCRYCFWCGAQYDDEVMAGCPGPEEELH